MKSLERGLFRVDAWRRPVARQHEYQQAECDGDNLEHVVVSDPLRLRFSDVAAGKDEGSRQEGGAGQRGDGVRCTAS